MHCFSIATASGLLLGLNQFRGLLLRLHAATAVRGIAAGLRASCHISVCFICNFRHHHVFCCFIHLHHLSFFQAFGFCASLCCLVLCSIIKCCGYVTSIRSSIASRNLTLAAYAHFTPIQGDKQSNVFKNSKN